MSRPPRTGGGWGGNPIRQPIGGIGAPVNPRPPGGGGVAPGAPSQTPGGRPGGAGGAEVGGNPPANRPPGTQPGADGTPGTNQPRPGADGGGADVPGQNRPPPGGDAGAGGASAAPSRTWAGWAGNTLGGVGVSAGVGLGLAGATGGFGGMFGAAANAGASVANTALVVEGVKAIIETLTGAAGAAFESLAENPINLAIVAGVVAVVVLR